MGRSSFVPRAAGSAALAALAAAGWFAIQLARADAEFRKGTPEGVERAVELQPRNTAFLLRKALETEYAGGDAGTLLEAVAAITPRASAPRIQLGLSAEARGDSAEAEQQLLEAARVDHQYLPRWTLANFYFRQQKTDEFWKWIRAAMEMSYGDRSAAFALALAADPTGKTVWERAIPPQHDVVAAYLTHMGLGRDRMPVIERLLEWHDPADRAELNRELDGEVELGKHSAALEIWRDLGYPEPAGIVFNPDFAIPHIGHGIDWLFQEQTGVAFTVLDTPPALRISFDGKQPAQAVVLKQLPDLHPAGRYMLRWESRTRGFPANTGLEWNANRESGPIQSSDDWKPGQFEFRGSPDSHEIHASYARPAGQARAEGYLELHHISIEEQKP